MSPDAQPHADGLTIAERVAASRAAQGLPPKVTDPAAIERIAAVARDRR